MPAGTIRAVAASIEKKPRQGRKEWSKFMKVRQQLAGILCAVALSFAPAAAQQNGDYGRQIEEWVSQVRFIASLGYNSTGVINVLTFRDGPGHSGWNWQLTGAYPLQHPFFVEGGLMGWTMARSDRPDAKRFGLTAGAGLRLGDGASEVGLGFIPGGGRLFVRRFLDTERAAKGPVVQLGLVFPTPVGTRSFTDLSIGYAF